MTLETPVASLPMVRGTVRAGLTRLGIETVRHLLFHFPTRHEDRREITAIHDVTAGVPVVIQGVLRELSAEAGFRRRGGRTRRVLLTHGVVEDATGSLPLLWFHQRFLEKQYPAGSRVLLSGTVTLGTGGLTMVAPEIERVREGKMLIHAGRLVPVYPETAGVTSRLFRFLISRALPLASELTEYLPEETRNADGLVTIHDAVRSIHFPETPEDLAAARTRLAFDELFILQLAALVRRRARLQEHGIPLAVDEEQVFAVARTLPFSLTPSQDAAVREILADLRGRTPMYRLLAGDVGSGKTVVAGLAAVACAQAGAQAALAAPTEILASQHADTLTEFFRGAGLRVALLTSSSSLGEREEIATNVRSGSIDLLVGTHALFHADLNIRNLALVIVDEQHRFGVEQRAELTTRRRDGGTPHFLSLSATPIPRTFQLTAYGDVDVTPLAPRPGQQVVRTEVVPPDVRNTVYASLENRMRSGEQIFVICPRVEEGEEEMRSVVTEVERLQREIFPTFRVGMLHGKLPSEEKRKTLEQFRARKLDLLVSSSVVEVGVDIPNATALLIEGAERFGLAQLHQFRGRVGRRGQAAVCYLAATDDSESQLDRLRVIERTTDGLAIAEEDLRRRGAGEIYGTRQSGGVRLRVANLADLDFLQRVRRAAEALLARDPELTTAPLLKRRIAQLRVTTHFE